MEQKDQNKIMMIEFDMEGSNIASINGVGTMEELSGNWCGGGCYGIYCY